MPDALRAGWGTCARPLVAEHDVLLLDLDGVVYVGPLAVPGAPEALALARRAGARLAFVTNNAARPPDVVARHLSDLGIDAEPADVVTSAQAAASMLAAELPAGARVLAVGGEGLRQALTARGLTPVASAEDGPVAVVQGFAPETSWTMLLEACVGVHAGLPWVATNTDLTIPTPRGTAPGNGALVEVVRVTTGGTPRVAGKPFRPLMDESCVRTNARRALVVGDRLDTDIAGAHAAGLPSLLVLTGVSGAPELLRAEPRLRPTYLASDLFGLHRSHAAPRREGDAWVGRAFRAFWERPEASAADSVRLVVDRLPVSVPAGGEFGRDRPGSGGSGGEGLGSGVSGGDRLRGTGFGDSGRGGGGFGPDALGGGGSGGDGPGEGGFGAGGRHGGESGAGGRGGGESGLDRLDARGSTGDRLDDGGWTGDRLDGGGSGGDGLGGGFRADQSAADRLTDGSRAGAEGAELPGDSEESDAVRVACAALWDRADRMGVAVPPADLVNAAELALRPWTTGLAAAR
ncbi:MAG TPA: HAD-IIA family hydrolase [Actinomycetales bacterium]|nr:HAD-IIA family hydrolase [Actinomycetales bacterium]